MIEIIKPKELTKDILKAIFQIELMCSTLPTPYYDDKEELDKVCKRAVVNLLVKDNKKHRIVGYATLENNKGEWYLANLAVAIKCFRMGFGTELVNGIIDYIIKNDKRKTFKIILHVAIQNEPAINFYKQLGFTITEISPDHYWDKADAYVMEITMVS